MWIIGFGYHLLVDLIVSLAHGQFLDNQRRAIDLKQAAALAEIRYLRHQQGESIGITLICYLQRNAKRPVILYILAEGNATNKRISTPAIVLIALIALF